LFTQELEITSATLFNLEIAYLSKSISTPTLMYFTV